MKLTHEKSWYMKKWSIDILIDIIGGIFIAVGTYNFAAAAEFPVVGLNGIALIFYHLFGLPIGRVALILNIPIALFCFRILGRNFFLRFCPDNFYYFFYHGLCCPSVPCISRGSYAGCHLYRRVLRSWLCTDLYAGLFHRRR